MKKNISINIFGTIYAIDEDAYQLLDNYINGMKNYFRNEEFKTLVYVAFAPMLMLYHANSTAINYKTLQKIT